MSDTDGSVPPAEALQFDRATFDAATDAEATDRRMRCQDCNGAVGDEYWHVDGRSVCQRCRNNAESGAGVARGSRTMMKAVFAALGGAIAGAILYYAVIALTGLEIGIIAIACGYLVGLMINKATNGRGGRRYQILAAVMTYYSVGLAYTPVALKEIAKRSDSTAVAAAAPDSTQRASTSAAATATAGAASDSSGVVGGKPSEGSSVSLLLALAVVLAAPLVLPVLVVVGSMPGGLLSALIIGIGIRQAWMMTRARVVDISGPYRVGGPVAASG